MEYVLIIKSSVSRVTRDCSTEKSASLCFIQAVAAALDCDLDYEVTMMKGDDILWEAAV